MSSKQMISDAKAQPNKDLIDYKDLPEPEVIRKDGLVTKDDIKELIQEVFKGSKEEKVKPAPVMPKLNISISFGGFMDDMSEKVKKVKKVKG